MFLMSTLFIFSRKCKHQLTFFSFSWSSVLLFWWLSSLKKEICTTNTGLSIIWRNHILFMFAFFSLLLSVFWVKKLNLVSATLRLYSWHTLSLSWFGGLCPQQINKLLISWLYNLLFFQLIDSLIYLQVTINGFLFYFYLVVIISDRMKNGAFLN
jgi:hypothetical protein